MFSSMILPASGKKIAACFAAAAAGGVLVAGTKMYIDETRASFTPAQITANKNYTVFFNQCLSDDFQIQVENKTLIVKKRLENREAITPEDLTLPAPATDYCAEQANRQSRQDLVFGKIYPWSVLPLMIGLFAIPLGTLGGTIGAGIMIGEAVERRRKATAQENEPS